MKNKLFNEHHLLKSQLLMLNTGRCKHGHLYTKHPVCFKNEIIDGNRKIRIGFLDIETFGMSFNANHGFMITYYVKEYDKNKYYHGKIKYKDVYDKKVRDKNLLKQLVNDLKNFDVIITYNGTNFDIPYIRTRCLMQNVPFIAYGNLKHIDLYYLIKSKFKLNRKSLKNACECFKIKGKSCVKLDVWIDAILGDQKKLDEIDVHNKGDVDTLNKLYNKVFIYSRKINRSI